MDTILLDLVMKCFKYASENKLVTWVHYTSGRQEPPWNH